MKILEKVTVSKTTVTIQISAAGLGSATGFGLTAHQVAVQQEEHGGGVLRDGLVSDIRDPLKIILISHLLRCGKQVKLILGTEATAEREPDPRLVLLVAKARAWFNGPITGRYPTLKHIATKENYDKSYVGRLISLAFLAPDIVERILTGDHNLTLTPERLRKACPLPSHWNDQRAILLD